MELKSIKKVGILGSGTMGQGISQAIALSGYAVILYDINSEALDQGYEIIKINIAKGVSLGKFTAKEGEIALNRIETTTNIRELVADLIIEAIVEKLDSKVKVIKEVEKYNHSSCILATNTSSIPITQIAAALSHPERFLGIHFFNPAHIMKLVEVIAGASTSSQVTTLGKAFVTSLNKTPVSAQDAPGFIVNRVARHYYVESLKLVEEGVASYETVDKLMEATGFKMGPFKLMDLIGIDTNFTVTKSIYNAFHQEPKFRPSRLQQQKVDAGNLGKKSGKGFYDYK